MFDKIKNLYNNYIKSEDKLTPYRSKLKKVYNDLQQTYQYKQEIHDDYNSKLDSYYKNFIPFIKADLNEVIDEKVYAGVIILNKNNEILILRRSSNDEFKPNKWCLPGGGIDEEDKGNPYQTAYRELKEETKLDISDLYPVYEYRDNGVQIFYYIGYLERMQDYQEIVLDKEHDNWNWISFNEVFEYPLILDLDKHLVEIDKKINLAYNSNNYFIKALNKKWDQYFDTFLETIQDCNKVINKSYKNYIETIEELKDSIVNKGLGKWRFQDYLESSLGYERKDIPQIDKDNLDDFILHFQGNSGKGDTKVKKEKKRIGNLKMAQGEIDEDKVLNMMLSGDINNKFIISNDGYLLDGHHNFAGQLELDSEQEVDVYRINLPFKELMRRSKLMKIARKEDVNTDIVNKDFDKSKQYVEKSKSDLVQRKVIDKHGKPVIRWVNPKQEVGELQGSLGISRKDMPQVKEKHYDKLKKYMKDNGISLTEGNIKVSDIKPIQNELNYTKVKNLANNASLEKLSKPILLSKDNRLLDGHHRWAALTVKDVEHKIDYVKFDADTNKLLNLLNDFDKTNYNDVNKSENNIFMPIPNYKPSEGEVMCGNCGAYYQGYCELYNQMVKATYVCDKWYREIEEEDEINKSKEAAIGEIREWSDGFYQKKINGWKFLGKENPNKLHFNEKEKKKKPVQYHIRQTEHPVEDLKRNWSAPVGGTLHGESIKDTWEGSILAWAKENGYSHEVEDWEDGYGMEADVWESILDEAPEYAYHSAYDAYVQVHYEGLGSYVLDAETDEEAKQDAKKYIEKRLTAVSDEGDGFDASRVEDYWQVAEGYWVFEVRV